MSNDDHPIRVVVRATELDDNPEAREALYAKLKTLLKQAAAEARRIDAGSTVEIEITVD